MSRWFAGAGVDGGRVHVPSKQSPQTELCTALDHKALFASHSLTRFPPASPLPHPSSPLTPRVSQVPCKLRFVALAAFLRARLAAPAARVLVFLSTRDSVEFYHAVLHGAWQEAVGQLQGDDPLDALPVLKLHGDMDQVGFRMGPSGKSTREDVE